jgi:DMSO/TMAO reductase YedYZ molybdopterin-dependent catalytic subunit
VLHQGAIPEFDPATWDFRIWGLVGRQLTLTWDEFCALPRVSASGDLHCVTRWSSLGHEWGAVLASELLELAGAHPLAQFVLLHGEGGYTANLPLAAVLDEAILLATHHDGEPLTPEHGAPLRAVAARRYAWKSVKWLRGIELLALDQPGFWESYGYSDSADVWHEERFSS